MRRIGPLLTLAVCLGWSMPEHARSQQRFADDFERGLGGWQISGGRGITVRPSGDPAHGNVLVLTPHGDDVFALIRGSERWGAVRVEGDMLFPTSEDSYLGFIYHYQQHRSRSDFGVLYLKGNENYLLPNPHRDRNVSRTLYEEFRRPLTGRAAVPAGTWQHFVLEVMDGDCHLYIGDLDEPQLTFDLFELRQGAVGFQPRSVGDEVWIDNVRVNAIARLAYAGPPKPAARYEPDSLLTQWEFAGPFEETRDDLARSGSGASWRPFATDRRGAIVTGRLTDYHGRWTVAYLRTRIQAAEAGQATLHFSTVDDLALWINGRFHWFVPRGRLAWFDFWREPDHAGQRIPITLQRGVNDIVIRVRGGVYASGGFFARLER